MSEQLGYEEELKGMMLRYFYDDEEMADSTYASLPSQMKDQMAGVYQQAFAEKPWNEKYRCVTCGAMGSDDVCRTPECANEGFDEAYPKQELIDDYFPNRMMKKFLPGILINAYDGNGNVIGFMSGGFTTPDLLVQEKYGGNEEILRSIVEMCAISPDRLIFYNNEVCTLPAVQKRGIGGLLSSELLRGAVSKGADVICGRSINEPWLRVKERQLIAAGFDFVRFTPRGDTFEMDGLKRQFYLAKK